MSIGLPASPDVRILSRMLQQLLEPLTTTPGVCLLESPIAISFPGIYGLRQQHIIDAVSYIGVETISSPTLHHVQYIMAAYTAHSRGLRGNDRNKETCEEEDLSMQSNTKLLVEYTGDALLLQASMTREASSPVSHDAKILAQYELGSHYTPGREGAAMVAWTILSFLRERHEHLGPFGKIFTIMTGRCLRSGIIEAVKETLSYVSDEVEVLVPRTEYFAARGAAQLACQTSRGEITHGAWNMLISCMRL
jgi:hypothetical protein